MNAQHFVQAFVAELRERATLLEEHGATEAGATCRQVAAQLIEAFDRWWSRELTVAEASEESGYSADRLRELVREGRLPDQRPPDNRGEIRLRRSDLPRRPRPAASSAAVAALAAQVLPGRR